MTFDLGLIVQLPPPFARWVVLWVLAKPRLHHRWIWQSGQLVATFFSWSLPWWRQQACGYLSMANCTQDPTCEGVNGGSPEEVWGSPPQTFSRKSTLDTSCLWTCHTCQPCRPQSHSYWWAQWMCFTRQNYSANQLASQEQTSLLIPDPSLMSRLVLHIVQVMGSSRFSHFLLHNWNMTFENTSLKNLRRLDKTIFHFIYHQIGHLNHTLMNLCKNQKACLHMLLWLSKTWGKGYPQTLLEDVLKVHDGLYPLYSQVIREAKGWKYYDIVMGALMHLQYSLPINKFSQALFDVNKPLEVRHCHGYGSVWVWVWVWILWLTQAHDPQLWVWARCDHVWPCDWQSVSKTQALPSPLKTLTLEQG